MNQAPDSGHELRPAFVSVAECEHWLANTPLTNPIQAQVQLLRQVNLLNRHNLPAGERLEILERLRKPLAFTQREAARRFSGKPLPLVPPEQASFDANQALWKGLLTGYTRCLEAALAGYETLRPQLALLLERALACLVDAQFDTYCAGFQPGAEHWQMGHQLYAQAETLGVADGAVEDKLRQGRAPASPRTAYAEALLLHATSPYELSLRHLGWVARWSRRWAGKIAVLPAAPAEARAQPLCVDLAGSEAAGYAMPEGAATPRWLDTSGLRQSLKKRIALLDQGTAPAELQLGEDCVQPACGRLLRQVYGRWCKGGVSRSHERYPVEGKCDIIAGVEAIHYFVAGRVPFKQPGHASVDLLRKEREEIATFGRTRRPEHYSQQQGFQVEQWQVVEEWTLRDESAEGLHATHATGHGGARITQGQLVAVRPASAQQLLLGVTRWAMVAVDAQLHAGVLVIPGRPEAVAVRSTGLAAVKEPYRQAFLLPAVEALGAAANLVIPAGWFKAGRLLEVFGNRSWQVRLLELVDRGVDFDRASYEVVP